MDKEFIKNSREINKYLKILKRVAEYDTKYIKKYKKEKNYAEKYNKYFSRGGEIPRYIPPHKRGNVAPKYVSPNILLERYLNKFSIHDELIFNNQNFNIDEGLRYEIRNKLLKSFNQNEEEFRDSGYANFNDYFSNYLDKNSRRNNLNKKTDYYKNKTFIKWFFNEDDESFNKIKELYYKNWLEKMILFPKQKITRGFLLHNEHIYNYSFKQFRRDEKLSLNKRTQKVFYDNHFKKFKEYRKDVIPKYKQNEHLKIIEKNNWWIGHRHDNSCDLSKIPENQKILMPEEINKEKKQFIFGDSIVVKRNGYINTCPKYFVANQMEYMQEVKFSQLLGWSIYLNRMYTIEVSEMNKEDYLISTRALWGETEKGCKYLPPKYKTLEKSIIFFNKKQIKKFNGFIFVYYLDNYDNLKLNIYLLFELENEILDEMEAFFMNYMIYDIYGNRVGIGKLFKLMNTIFDELFIFLSRNNNVYEYLPVRNIGETRLFFITKNNLENLQEVNRNNYKIEYNLDGRKYIVEENIRNLLDNKQLINVTQKLKKEIFKVTRNYIPLFNNRINNQIKKLTEQKKITLRQYRNVKFNNITELDRINTEIKDLKKHRKSMINRQIDRIRGGSKLLSLKFINNDIDTYYNEKITTLYFDIYEKLYHTLYDKDYKKKYKFIYGFNFVHIINYSSNFNKKILKDKNIKNEKSIDFIINNNINILSNSFLYNNTLIYYELIYKNKLFDFKKNNVNILFFNKKTDVDFIEACNFYNKKYKNFNLNNNLFIFKKYNKISKNNNSILRNSEYLKENNIKIKVYDYLNLDFIKNNDKFDLICNNIRCMKYEIEKYMSDQFLGYADVQINYLVLLFSLYNLKKNGNLILYLGVITHKSIADLILIGKKYFKETLLNNVKLISKSKYSGAYVVFKDFQGINNSELIDLLNIGEKLLDNDPTSCFNFTITNKKLIEKIKWKREPKKGKLIKEFLNLDILNKEYDFIRQFNEEFYLEKIVFVKKMIEYYNLYFDKEILKSIREEQLIHSYAYAKEFNLKTIKFPSNFLKDFKTMIAEDIYKLYTGKTYELVSSNNNYNEFRNAKILIKDDITNLEEEYYALLDSYNNEVKDLKDENLWIKYYELGSITDELKDKLEKHTTIKISDKHYQEWFKYYEVFIKFNSLISKSKKNIKGLHLCEPTMVSVSALRYYNLIHNENLLSYNWFIQNIDCKECNKNIYNKFHNKFILKNFKNKNVINSLCKKVKDEKFNIIISNCSEKENVKKLFIIIFSLLNKNGSCVIKYQYPVLYKNLYLLNLCYKHFRKVSFYKPVYSNNTEFFIICQKYNPVSDKVLKELKTNTYKLKFSNHFKVNIKDMIQNITNDIIFEISKGIFYLRNNEELPKQTNAFIKKIVNKKNDEWFKIFMPINLKSKKKVSFFDVSIFAELFTIDNPIKLKFSHSNSLNNFNYNNNNNTRISFNKLTNSYGELDTLMDDKDKYPQKFYDKVVMQFEIFKDDRFKQQLKKDYGYGVSQGGMKMNEMLVSFKDLLPKKKLIKTFHICEAPGSFIKMIKYYVKNVLKGKLEYNVTSLDPKHKDNLKKYGTGILDYTNNINRNSIHYGENKTGDITNIKNILSMKKYCEDVDLITSDCGLGEHIRDKHAEKILFYSSLFMLINVPEGKNCLLKFYLPIIKDSEVSMIYTMYKYFKKVYMYKPIVNFRSGEFYLVCIDKKKVPEKIIKDLSLKNPKFEKVTNTSFLLQLYNFSKRIIDKRNLQLERILYLMDNYNLLTEKEFDLIEKIKEKRINNWMKANKL